MPVGAAIEIRGLSKRFGNVLAVDDLSFSVPRGSVTGFLGPNGAGKTTTMRCLLGLASPTSGEALVLGCRYETLTDPLRHVGAALEVTGFHPGRTARQHLRVTAIQGRLDPGRSTAVLEATGMTGYAARRVGGFSSGMRQRLALATALMGDPEVLVLDEPANGLDPAGVAWLRGALRGFAERGGAVLISSHILSEVQEVADRVVVLANGRRISEGDMDVLMAAGGGIVVRSPHAATLATALTSAGATVERTADDALTVTGMPIERVGELAAQAGAVLHELRVRTTSLEETFLALTGEGDTAS
jgi:ABC-2 type transport system ATP-binding protein